MSDKVKQPAVRFVGHTNDWEQRKISELGLFSKGTGYSKSDIRDKGTPLILYGRLYTKYETVIRAVDTFTTPKDGSVYSRGGEVIVPASGETAEDISIASVVEKAGVILGGDLNIITPQSGIDSAFLALSISHGVAHRSLSKLAQGKSVVHIHNSDIQTVEVGIPVQAEQESISQFFEKVDGLITLHQRKYDKLVNVKKSLLDKMFPKKGAVVPEVRFAGFTDAWEQRKISELGLFSKGTGYSKSDIRDKGTPLILYGRLYTKYETVIRAVDTFTTPKDGSVYSRGGEVIVPASGETAEDISIASVVEKAGVILGGDLNIITPQSGIDSAFLALSISHGVAHRSLSKLAQGKSVVHIHNSDIQTVEVGIPVQAEQESISQFFEKVDGLITLHQRKLEKLENIKKAFLEKIFI